MRAASSAWQQSGPAVCAAPPTLRLVHLPCRAHFAFVYLNVFWTSWLIVEYYKVCCSIRPMLPSSRASTTSTHVGCTPSDAVDLLHTPALTPCSPGVHCAAADVPGALHHDARQRARHQHGLCYAAPHTLHARQPQPHEASAGRGTVAQQTRAGWRQWRRPQRRRVAALRQQRLPDLAARHGEPAEAAAAPRLGRRWAAVESWDAGVLQDCCA